MIYADYNDELMGFMMMTMSEGGRGLDDIRWSGRVHYLPPRPSN